MSVFDRLQPDPLDEYQDCNYSEHKEMHIDRCNFFYDYCSKVQPSGNNTLLEFEFFMNENGMEKFVAMLAVTLFEISHDDVEPDQAYGVMHDIKDFETGDYDHLFTDEDLKLIKSDIKIIKDYIKKHPELLYEENLSPLE